MSKMIKCKTCGNDIAKKAKTCPSCGVKNKKPFYTKWWFILIALLVVIVAISSGGSKTETTKDTASSTVTSSDDTKNVTESKKEEKKDNKIKSGTYKVGTDLPAGEYLVIAKSMSYIECTKDSTGALESVVFNDNLTANSNSYVTLKDGEYFKLTGGEMYAIAEAPSIIPSDGLYKDGMYKVGKDIPAGEYKVSLTGSMGYTEVTTNSRHQLDSVVTNENVQSDTYLTVKEGQYLKMTGVQIQK